MNHLITQNSIHAFKTKFCNENQLIVRILQDQAPRYFLEPILDVGSGLGDITVDAFPDKRVIHLDTLNVVSSSLPKTHARVVGDFFEFHPREQIGTILMSHVLQYLDEDIGVLNNKIIELAPTFLVTVTNTNENFMCVLLDWFDEVFPDANPEIALPNFGRCYVQKDIFPFVADLGCPDFATLAAQVCYLFEVEPSRENSERVEKFLKRNLQTPAFQIQQQVTVYKKAARLA